MPSGHADKATINERRPLSDFMREMLRRAAEQPLYPANLSRPEKNSTYALFERGMVEFTEHGFYTINDAGRAMLAQPR